MCLSHVGTAAVAAQHCHRPVPQLPYCCLSPAAACPGVPCVQEGLSCQQRLRKACLAPALPSRSQSVCWLGCGVPGQPGLGALWGSCLLCFFISSLWKHFCSSCEEQGFLDETMTNLSCRTALPLRLAYIQISVPKSVHCLSLYLTQYSVEFPHEIEAASYFCVVLSFPFLCR